MTLLGSRTADIVSAARKMGVWMDRHLGITWGSGGDLTEFLTIQEEHARKKAPKPAARGCPGLDMDGYVIHRTYTTIRPRIYKRARRTYIRAQASVEATGTVNIQRARRMASYYGYYKQTNSAKAKKKAGVEPLKNLAAHVVAYHGRAADRRRREANARWLKSA